MFVIVKCPSCGAECDLDENRELAFCSYCGAKMFRERNKSEVFGVVSIDTKKTLLNYMERATNYELDGDYDRALEYFNRVLDIDASNEEAIAGERRARGIVDFDNVEILAGKSIKGILTVHVLIDGIDHCLTNTNKQFLCSCDVGIHEVECFTAMSNVCKKNFRIKTPFDEKRVLVETGMLGLKVTFEDV